MLIILNGQSAEITNDISVQDLLNTRGIQGRGFIIELNGQIIRAESWPLTRFNQNDRLEIIRIIGGG